MGLVLLWLPPLAAIVCAVFFYRRRRVHAAVYILAIVICAGIAGYFGMLWGAGRACSGPHPGNQCFLAGVFVAGPVAAALATFLVGLALSVTRPGTATAARE
jgi:purine-cytosine permease-like protein